MINTFLKIKHWQLFILAFAIPMFILTIFMSITMGQVSQVTETTIDFEQIYAMMLNYSKVSSVVMSVIIIVLFTWYWAVCVGLQEKVPEHAKMNVRKFKIFYFIGLAYSLFFVGLIAFLIYNLPNIITGVVSVSSLGTILTVLTSLHFFAIFCLLYCLYFAAKTIKTVELQRQTTLSDFIGEFLLIWFFPIGVWIIQPKVNELATTDYSSDDDMDWLDDE